MKYYWLLFLITFYCPMSLLAQEEDEVGVEVKQQKAKNEDYKIISHINDTTFVDTTLSIYKEYKFNYLRKDNFDLIEFSNIGQAYNSLSHNFYSNNLRPLFGARGRHFNYIEIEDINYYNVATPLTELMFKTAFEQGQLLDSFFTVNTSPNLNFSIAFKGLRSLGKYQNIRTSTRNFRFTTNYKTSNDKYYARIHITSQGLSSQENGGLRDEDIPNFESGVEEFLDRSVFSPRFEDAENDLEGTRIHFEHFYKLQDSLNNNRLSIGNIISFEEKSYEFDQTSQNDFFGDAFINSNLSDRVTNEDFYAEANVNYSNTTLGDLKFNLGYATFNYGYDALVNINGSSITNRLEGNVTSVGGAYKNKIGGFLLDGKFGINVAGDLDGNFLNANAGYNLNEDTSVSAGININSNSANYNLLLYQSDYINYNWQNNFDNVETKQFAFNLNSNKLVNLELDYTTINNYAYFERQGANNLVSPSQTNETINYFRVKLAREFKYKKFALNNTVRYQNVLDGEGILNVPDFNVRSTLYFTDKLFKKALFIQTGITLNYFTKYNADAYDPLLAEFYTQNDVEIGDFPRLDFFINMKVRQTRIFLKAEHFNSSFTGFNFFSAPNQPYRDFVIRFGLVWNFFL
ncbi:hypothetical protein D7030_00375 [Flavobacteriaceae bacterium AU392]|nr:hypothetical protein D1817_14060 [Flavobacteriaceae bacterium]RKM86988.1 hypothetical protein D7030_00375 [Flavobacteriaceae bacterium AU392]